MRQVSTFLLVSLLLSLLSSGLPVHAQTNGQLNLTVSPSTLELAAQPGKTVHAKIRVHNNDTAPVTLKVEVNKITPSPDQSGVSITELEAADEIRQWISFDQSKFVAPPNEWTDISLTIAVPDTAAFGYYFALVVSPALSQGAQTRPTTYVTGGIAVLGVLTVSVPQGALAEAQLVEFKPKAFINEWLPADFMVRIRNSGNIHIKPRGNIFIHDGRGKDVALLEVNPGQGIILPNAVRSFETSWTDGFLVREPVIEHGAAKMDSKGEPITQLAIHWDKLTHIRLGRYTADLLMVFDNGTRDVTIEGTTSFWVIPYKLILAVVAIIVLLVLIIRWILRVYIKRQVRKHRHG